MRNLTLGVLIVTGGTLAALPFRRSVAIPDASSQPTQATGPTDSALATAPTTTLTVDTDQLTEALSPWPQSAAAISPRRIDIPLTFDDLMKPIDRPLSIENRFGAVAEVRAKQKQRERDAAVALEMPAMEELPVSLQQDLKEKLVAKNMTAVDRDSIDHKNARRTQPITTGSLASVTKPSAETQRLPKPQKASDERHWIRQPK